MVLSLTIQLKYHFLKLPLNIPSAAPPPVHSRSLLFLLCVYIFHSVYVISFFFVCLGSEPTPIASERGSEQFKDYVGTDICVVGRILKWSIKIPDP